GAANVNALTAGGQGLAVTVGNAQIILPMVGDTAALGYLTASVGPLGVLGLIGNVTTDAGVGGRTGAGALDGGGPLGTDVTIDTDANGDGTGGAVNLSGVLAPALSFRGPQAFSVKAGNGAVSLGVVGTPGQPPLSSLSVTTTGITTLNGDVSTDA